MKILGIDTGVTDERYGMPVSVGYQTQTDQIKQLTEERDTYKQALDDLGVTPAEAKAGVARSKALREERDKLKSALESLCNTGYSQPTNKAWTAAREALKG